MSNEKPSITPPLQIIDGKISSNLRLWELEKNTMEGTSAFLLLTLVKSAFKFNRTRCQCQSNNGRISLVSI